MRSAPQSGRASGPRAARIRGRSWPLTREELRRDRYAHYRPYAVLRAALDQPPPDLHQDVLAELRLQQGKSQPYAGMKRHFARVWGLPGPR